MHEQKDSLLEFQSSIFDASDGHALVEFIRKKKGLRVQPQRIFNDVQKDRQSLQIEIQRLDDADKTLQNELEAAPQPHEDEVDTNQPQNQARDEQPTSNTTSPKSTVSSPASNAPIQPKRNSVKSLGRRTLLKEFEKTLQESRFLPPTCSTPLSATTNGLVTGTHNHIDEDQSKNRRKLLDYNIIGTPITISDDDGQDNRADRTDTEELMDELYKENDFLLQLAKEEFGNSMQNTPKPQKHVEEQQECPTTPARLASSPNRNLTPHKEDRRRTYTIRRSETSGKLVVQETEESRREPLQPKTPPRYLKANKKRLIATPEQKKLLLSRFGVNVGAASVQKTSRIPVKARATEATTNGHLNTSKSYENEQHQTTHLIERLQKNSSSNAPIIVIPLNQTFNQAPVTAVPGNVTENVDKTQVPTPTTAEVTAPSQHKSSVAAETTTTATRSRETEENLPQTRTNSPVIMDNLRLDDILTEDESVDEQPLALIRERRSSRRNQVAQKSLKNNASATNQTCKPKTLTLSLGAPRSSNPILVRELITANHLAQMTNNDILDLRKRNSQGELRKTFNLTERESSMVDKQIELELLRRSVQKDNVSLPRMDVLPLPPDEFRDQQANVSTSEDNFIDERSSDKVSLSQSRRLSQVVGVRKPRRKKKKMSEQVEKYLEVSQKLPKSKYLNQSKRKLYCKGQSDVSTSDDSSPHRTLSNKSSSRRSLSTSHRSSRNLNKPLPPPAPFSSPLQQKASLSEKSSSNTSRTSSKRPVVSHPSPSSSSSPSQRKSRSPKKSSNTSRRRSPSSSRKRPISPPSPTPSSSTSLPSPERPAQSHVFKRPIGKAPKSKAVTQKSRSVKENQSPGKKGRKGASQQTSSASSSRSQIPAGPVEPENPITSPEPGMNSGQMLRRSKRERIPPTAYWSNSQKDLRPLYDVNILLMRRKNLEKKPKNGTTKKAKQLSNKGASLVESTTILTESTNQVKRGTGKKQKRNHEAKAATEKVKKTKKLDTIPVDSECPSYHGSSNPDDHRQQPTTTTSDRNQPTDSHSNDNDLRPESRPASQSSECASDDIALSMQTTMRISDVTSQPVIKLIGPKSKQGKILRRAKRLQSASPTSTSGIEIDHRSSARKNRPSTDSISSAQQTRLTPVLENSVSELFHQQSTSVCDSEKRDSVRLSGLLMPPPKSVGVKKTATNKRSKKGAFRKDHDESIADASTMGESEKRDSVRLSGLLMPPPKSLGVKKATTNKRSKKGAFRKDHDESIADASTIHVNKLFDQLKSSSMTAPADSKREGKMDDSGQVSRAKDLNALSLRHKCKKLTVQVARVNINNVPQAGGDKVCDSGFSSEDMTTDPKEKGGEDILLNWLKQILKNNRPPTNTQSKGIAKFLQLDGFRVANVENLIFQEVNGVDFAFYRTEEAFSFGYIRFKPKTEKKRSTAKMFELNFIVLCGTVRITVNNNTLDCKNGDLITVFVGTTYSMTNVSNDPALVMVIKK